MNKNELEELMLTLDETFHYVKDQSNNYLAQSIFEQMLIVTNRIKVLEEDENIDWLSSSNAKEMGESEKKYQWFNESNEDK